MQCVKTYTYIYLFNYTAFLAFLPFYLGCSDECCFLPCTLRMFNRNL